jgi:hypothetical protein
MKLPLPPEKEKVELPLKYYFSFFNWSVVSSLYQKHSRKVGGFGNRFVCIDSGVIMQRVVLNPPRSKSP